MADPRHIAIVPDGNRRWAKLNGVSPLEGHQKGASVMLAVVNQLLDTDLEVLTLWGFSTDNWKRSPEEVRWIMALLGTWLASHTSWLNQQGIKVRHIGRRLGLPDDLVTAIDRAVDLTSGNTGMTLNVAFNYSGRAEILDAVRALGEHFPGNLDEATFSDYLYTGGLPDVDLVIRTAGEYRLSNFLLWQTAYSEFFTTPILWPDFTGKDLDAAIAEYHRRAKRQGGD